jgi:hypothetical protein
MLPGLDLSFDDRRPSYDSEREQVNFVGQARGATVQCAISREALEDHFDADDLDEKGRVKRVRDNMSTIRRMARTKFLSWPVEEPEAVLIGTDEVPQLLKESKPRRPLRAKGRAT